MCRIRLVFVATLVLGMLMASIPASADPGDRASFQRTAARELAPAQCGGGAPLINIVEGVQNDADSAVSGSVWAFDAYMRQIDVRQIGTNTYCAIARYVGTFVTEPGVGPAGTGELAGGIRGTLYGGYRLMIVGTPLDTAAWSTHGYVGTFDYACDRQYNCPGYVNWIGQYFQAGYNADSEPWWGWRYDTAKNGDWINSVEGNFGNITGD